MNKFFQFNDLYTTAEHFYEIKAYLSCLAYLNKALSFDFPAHEKMPVAHADYWHIFPDNEIVRHQNDGWNLRRFSVVHRGFRWH